MLPFPSFQQENRYLYVLEKNAAWSSNLSHLLIVLIHFFNVSLSVARTRENMKLTRKNYTTRVEFVILTNRLGEWAVHFNQGSRCHNPQILYPMIFICGRVRSPPPCLPPKCPCLLTPGKKRPSGPRISVALPLMIKCTFHNSTGNEILQGPLKLFCVFNCFIYAPLES